MGTEGTEGTPRTGYDPPYLVPTYLSYPSYPAYLSYRGTSAQASVWRRSLEEGVVDSPGANRRVLNAPEDERAGAQDLEWRADSPLRRLPCLGRGIPGPRARHDEPR
jgi:hypothetical protein